ncbi:MAG: c-type cytochrome [Rhodopseudomonas palustris]|uniref:C-type cytochrome n=1 Tax=Rhodopseudomonas palustris TaxID=1076 RepID=A0A933RY38_RHOPL|nr:c-type cytochrome [Rhodopseudomonas palustris]
MDGVERVAAVLLGAIVAAGLIGQPAARAEEPPPVWAYPMAAKGTVPPPDDGTVRRVPDSTQGYTLTQIRDLFFALDWRPEAHPPMPSIVALGRKPNLRACGSCHRPEGVGGPENASLAGLPAAYLRRQIDDYRSGARSTAVPARAHVFRMIAALNELTAAEIDQAVGYYAALKLPARIKVVESDVVPTSTVPNWYYTPKHDGTTEPLGDRIVEMPDDEDGFVNRDTRVTFTAHVPRGSVARGERLVAGHDAERVPACAGCHGDDLRGTDEIPPIAGRSPSMIVRQLYEFKTGLRHGAMAEPMKANTSRMTVADMTAIAAYLATLPP